MKILLIVGEISMSWFDLDLEYTNKIQNVHV